MSKILVVLIFLYSCVYAEAPIKEIRFKAYDADTNSRIKAIFSIDGQKISQPEKDADSKMTSMQLEKDADSRIAIEIEADAGNDYYPRTLTFFLEGLKEKKNKTQYFKIYLSKRNKKDYIYTRGHIRKASNYINKTSVDRAVALLERIQEEADVKIKKSQFGIYLSYNLGRAYLVNCKYKFRDQCQNGANIFLNLLTNYDSKKRWMEAESIRKYELKNTGSETFYNRMTYLRAKWFIQCERYDDALKEFRKLLNLKNINLAETIQITKKQLKDDIAYVENIKKSISN